jgi:D-alanyl-lipoteichoic acid acyltransferase DltB (MBOAT superfamily)
LENGKGIFLICLGLIKKCLVSDYISLNYVDRIFENPSLYTGMENLLGMYGYMVQIYCDFSGYTDMALGLALMMGFSLPDNFASPYLSFSLTDFWRRWHITLSSWLRDYLYIPLGGNRKGLFRQYINLMLTMLLGGLWHGASITFVVWGGMHGGMLAIERALNPLLKNIPAFIRKPFGWLITFHFVAACWVFFRAPGFAEAAAVFEGIFASFEASVLPALLSAYAPVMAMMGLGLLLSLAPVSFVNRSREGFARLPLLLQVGVLTLLIWAVLQVSSSQVQPFIYFRF